MAHSLPEHPRKVYYSLTDVLEAASREMTPYEETTWDILDGENRRTLHSDKWFVIYDAKSTN